MSGLMEQIKRCQILVETVRTRNREVRNQTIDEITQAFRSEWEEMLAIDMEDCINWADWLDTIAEEMKKGGNE